MSRYRVACLVLILFATYRSGAPGNFECCSLSLALANQLASWSVSTDDMYRVYAIYQYGYIYNRTLLSIPAHPELYAPVTRALDCSFAKRRGEKMSSRHRHTPPTAKDSAERPRHGL
ncbi:hypothetical protein BD311DRAFT_7763 [Dichomitus squalens]|uniref:Uncharacterized protein n=1 Tax=Dichomitus squalens TaxID=114155 RepID=A0A4Q9N989_9APHY|nr:hypothetical protein BD311DRAFT_7763 [Dichomitus squalens]